MYKNLLRLPVLVLALTLILSLAACGQSTSAMDAEKKPVQNDQEVQKPAATEVPASDPMVRLYFKTEVITNLDDIKIEYEENWWEKEEFSATYYSKSVYGQESSSVEYLNRKGEIRREGYKCVDFWRYENGELVYQSTEYDDNIWGILRETLMYRYDLFGRRVEVTQERTCLDPQNNTKSTTVYEYTETDNGSVGIFRLNDEHVIELHYDRNYRLIQQVFCQNNQRQRPLVWEYNSAGCMISEERIDAEGNISWTKIIYDFIEVPLSVAEKYPMFKWEYID